MVKKKPYRKAPKVKKPAFAEIKARAEELRKVPFGRRATATAGAEPVVVTCERCTPNSCMTAPGRHGQEARAASGAGKPRKERKPLGSKLDALLVAAAESRDSGASRVIGGKSVRIAPVPGKELVFATGGIRVEVMWSVEGEYIFELSQNGRVLGTANVAAHLKIEG